MSQMMPQPSGGIPPALLAVLASHQAGAQPGSPQPGPPPQAQPQGQDQPGGEDERQPIQILQQMIALGNKYIQVEPDAEDRATMAKLLATLHQYLATEQKDAEGALGGGAPTRLLRRLGS
jgi:hypothetical protein